MSEKYCTFARKMFVRQAILILLCACAVTATQAQDVPNYRRNALAMMLVYHPEDEFGEEIYKAFDSLPVPDKYDDYNIGWRVIDNSQIWGVQRKDSGYYKATYSHALTPSELRANALHTEHLLNDAGVAKEMVSKWFGMQGTSPEDAFFNAGEELQPNTFVLVNDITYVTAEQEAAAAKTAMNVIGGFFNAVTGGSAGKDVAEVGGAMTDSLTGFKVKTHSYLYQLEWNDSIAAIFYRQHYTAKPDPKKLLAFLNDKTTYRLKYVAHAYEFDKKSVLKGKYSRTELVRTICARSIDKNIVALGKQYEDFK